MKGENTMNSKIKDFLRKYTMVIALVIVFILFCALTDGRLLFAQNMSNLMLQNGYVLVLACGMLLCILTGGNIDLSVGSVICFVGGVAASGGYGSVVGTLVGIFVIMLLKTGLPYVGLQANWQQIITGVVLIVAVLIDILKEKKSAH
jgi:ABC-type xylose transport system permease subunit